MTKDKIIIGLLIAFFSLNAVFAAFSDVRTEIVDGDASLQGPIGLAFEKVVKNHVLRQDPVYLSRCFKDRTEDELWQTEFWGKYMHSAAPFWAITKCPQLKEKIDAGFENVVSAQLGNGYIGNYKQECRSIPGGWDVWGIKYTMLGLLHYYDINKGVNPEQAKRAINTCRKLCDYLIKSAGPNGNHTIGNTGNYAGMPSCSNLEPVMWLYNRTKEQKYLDFAKFIVSQMTELENGPRLLDLAQKGVPVADRSVLPSHSSVWSGVLTNRGKAYEMMSCYQGLIEYYEVTGRKDLLDAAIASAKNIIQEEINVAGSGASYEHWYHGAKHQHKPFMHTQETCVTITWMRLCEKLLSITGDSIWADQFEKTFYNAYLASMQKDGNLFAVYTPLDGTRSEGQIHCRMHTNCCNANGPRGFLSFIRSILQAKKDEVFLNYFVSSRTSIMVPALGKKASFEMHTHYPKYGEVDVRVRIAEPMKFKFSMRVPACVKVKTFKVNNQIVTSGIPDNGGYVTIDRTWNPGDAIVVDFALPVQMHRIEDHVAFSRGPVLLARDSRFGDGDIGAVLREYEMLKIFGDGKTVDFPVEYFSNQDDMRMVVSARLPIGGHDENLDRRAFATVKFCDYASAGNCWSPTNYYRVWIPLSHNPVKLMK
jgi:DUF1680 family protein